MPQPTPNSLHVDQYLTNMSIMWAQDQSAFIADKVFPLVPVTKESDLYAIYPKGYFFRDELEPRPLGGRPPEVGYQIESKRYQIQEWGLEHKIDDRVRANADAPFDPDLAAMRLLTGQAMIHREREWVKRFYATGIWGKDLTGVTTGTEAQNEGANQFLKFNTSGAEPVALFDRLRMLMASATGKSANTLVLGADVFRAIRQSKEILERIKYTQRGFITEDILAALFGVDRVVIPMAVQNSAQEGEADKIDFIFGKKSALLCYANPTPSLMDPSAGYTFAYTGLIPGLTNAYGGVIERGREELAHSDVFQIRAAYDMRITASELGFFLNEAV